MDRGPLIRATALGCVALALALPRLDTHGFWFDEAYTARLAALDWPRLLAGAARDIHPPGWPLLSGLATRLPLPAECALRLPSALGFAGLVALLGARSGWAAVALLLYGPLLEQSTQARPYALLAFGLVALLRLVEHARWATAGLVLAAVTTLHALAGPLCAAVLLAAFSTRRPGRADLVRLLAPTALTATAWLPSFLVAAGAYARDPWYATTSAADLWIVTDGGGVALAAAFVVVAAARDRALSLLAPAAAAVAVLCAIDFGGLGVELRKTGLAVLPLLLAGLGDSRAARLAAVASAGALGLTSVELPARPDLREAAQAVEAVGTNVPVVSVFASEAAWYLRAPTPLPSYRDPAAIADRISDVARVQRTACVVSIALPTDAPLPLAPDLHVIARADVTGLEVLLVGTPSCSSPLPGSGWSPPARP